MTASARESLGSDFVNRLAGFLDTYYREDILRLAERYPSEQRSLWVEFGDLYQFDPDLADDYLAHPGRIHPAFQDALMSLDLPVDIDLEQAHVRVTDTADFIPTHGVGDLRSQHALSYVGLSAQLANVSKVEDRFTELVFECNRCSTHTPVPQPFNTYQEPYECQGCDRKGPWTIDYRESTAVDHLLLKLKEPPEDAPDGQGKELIAYVEDDLVDIGGENGLADHAGERATVYGLLEYEQDDIEKRAVAPKHLRVEAIEFEDDILSDLELEAYQDDIKRLSNQPDIHDQLAASIAPELYADDRMQTVLEGAVLYLFGGYRKESADGKQFRGDIHLLQVGDPGTGKSTILENLATLSPRSEIVSGTQVTGVGLTASTVREAFAGEQFVLKPGVLPRANGGHAIVDELDKAGKEASSKMHDALEKSQRIRVSKGGIKATLDTRAGLAAGANPKDGRFNRYDTIAEQIDLDPALVSRFDLIFAMQDQVDEALDERKAEHVLTAVQETGAAERGEPVENGETDPPIPPDLFTAYLAEARKHYQPTLPDGPPKQRLKEFYVDTRQENRDDEDAPVPITARKLEAGVRLAEASARVRHDDTITLADVERAIRISKRVIGDVHWDPETGQLDANRVDTNRPRSQEERIRTIRQIIEDQQNEYDDGVPIEEVVRIAGERNMDASKAEHEIDNLIQGRELYEPANGHVRCL